MSKSWKPSRHMELLVIGELLAQRAPVRFRDLWSRCEGRLCKASFVNALEALVKGGLVIREVRSRKHVEFRLNPHNPEVKQRLSQAERDFAQEEEIRKGYEQIMHTFSELMSKVPKGSRQMKTLIKALVYAHACLLASAEIRFTFREADMAAAHGENSFIQRVYPQMLGRFRLIQRKGIIDLSKADGKIAREAFNEWLADLEARTHEVLEETRRFLRTAS